VLPIYANTTLLTYSDKDASTIVRNNRRMFMGTIIVLANQIVVW
jgi:hypothetical protein